MLYVLAACSHYMSMVHVHSACPCSMFKVRVNAASPSYMLMLHVSLLRVHVASLCCMSILWVLVVCPCRMSLLHVYAVYLCCKPMSMLNVHDAWHVHAVCPCCTLCQCYKSMLHVMSLQHFHVACPSRMSTLHVGPCCMLKGTPANSTAKYRNVIVIVSFLFVCFRHFSGIVNSSEWECLEK
jgi:hypothetical protein